MESAKMQVLFPKASILERFPFSFESFSQLIGLFLFSFSPSNRSYFSRSISAVAFPKQGVSHAAVHALQGFARGEAKKPRFAQAPFFEISPSAKGSPPPCFSSSGLFAIPLSSKWISDLLYLFLHISICLRILTSRLRILTILLLVHHHKYSPLLDPSVTGKHFVQKVQISVRQPVTVIPSLQEQGQEKPKDCSVDGVLRRLCECF